jgi:hypothetical protein
MANPRNNTTGRELEQQPSLEVSLDLDARSNNMSATRVPSQSRQHNRFSFPPGPAVSTAPSYIPNPFEENVRVRSTAELGPDPYPICSASRHLR